MGGYLCAPYLAMCVAIALSKSETIFFLQRKKYLTVRLDLSPLTM